MKKTREDQEIRDLDELFDRYRRAPESYVFAPLADACRKMGRIEEALEICEGGLRRHPDYPSGHVVRGKCLYDKGDRAAAREAFERVLLLDENNLVALKYLGMIEADAGNFSAAKRHFRQILSLDPENKEITAILRSVDEQEQAAETLYAPSVDVMEDVDEILQGVALEPEEVEGATETEGPPETLVSVPPASDGGAEDLETSDELASVTLAEIFASQGYTAKAEKIYREILRKQPGREDIRRRLRELSGEPSGAVGEGRPMVPDDAAGESEGPSRLAGLEPSEAPTESPPVTARQEAPGQEEGRPGEEIPRDKAARPEISDRDSLDHFKRWLARIQK